MTESGSPSSSAPAKPPQGRLGLALVLLGLAGLVAFALALVAGQEPELSEPLQIPGPFVAYVGSAGLQTDFDSSWHGGEAPADLQTRHVREEPANLGGLAHQHEAWVLPGRRLTVAQEAWFRPSADGSAWLCARRRVGKDVLDLSPPLPVLQLPLEAGASWTWKGLVGEREALATFEVLERSPEGTLVIRQTTTLPTGATSTVTRTYEPGQGLVREEGTFPYEPEGDSVVVTRRPDGDSQ